MSNHNVCIAITENHQQAKSAFDGLLESGFDAHQISVIGKEHRDDKHIHGYATTGERVKFWGEQGAFSERMMGMLAGTGFLFVPGIGPLIVGGPLLSMIVGGLEGSAGLAGIEAVFAGLLHLGFSKDGLAHFEKELKAGKSLILVHGNADEVIRAKNTLNNAGVAVASVHLQ